MSALMVVSMFAALLCICEGAVAADWRTNEALRAFGKTGDAVKDSSIPETKKTATTNPNKIVTKADSNCIDCKQLLLRLYPDTTAYIDCNDNLILTNTRILSIFTSTGVELTTSQASLYNYHASLYNNTAKNKNEFGELASILEEQSKHQIRSYSTKSN